MKAKSKDVLPKCPDGYTAYDPGTTIDLLGKTELWRIHENHLVPERYRIPQDFFGFNTKRVPKEWGRCLFYKTI